MALDRNNDTSNLFCMVLSQILTGESRIRLGRLPEWCKITGSHPRKLEVTVFPHCNYVQRITMFETA